jgi:hypothetical protein
VTTIRRRRWRGWIIGTGIACACFGSAFALGSADRDEPVSAVPVTAAPAAATPAVTGLGEPERIPRLLRGRPAPEIEQPTTVTPTEPDGTAPPEDSGSSPYVPGPSDGSPQPVDPGSVDPPAGGSPDAGPPDPGPSHPGPQEGGGGESTFGGG